MSLAQQPTISTDVADMLAACRQASSSHLQVFQPRGPVKELICLATKSTDLSHPEAFYTNKSDLRPIVDYLSKHKQRSEGEMAFSNNLICSLSVAHSTFPGTFWYTHQLILEPDDAEVWWESVKLMSVWQQRCKDTSGSKADIHPTGSSLRIGSHELSTNETGKQGQTVTITISTQDVGAETRMKVFHVTPDDYEASQEVLGKVCLKGADPRNPAKLTECMFHAENIPGGGSTHYFLYLTQDSANQWWDQTSKLRV